MHYLTGEQAARMLGISRKTLYRWMAEVRLCSTEWTIEQIEARKHELGKRPRGPARNPRSVRYNAGRHSFTEVRGRAVAAIPPPG